MSAWLDDKLTLGEVKLKVSKLERSIAFYERVVGLRLQALDAERKVATFTAGDGERTLLVLEEIADALVPGRRSHAGLYHFAILLPDRRSLSLALRNLAQSGIHIGQADHLVSEALYIADPDHNGIEIYADRPREQWERDEEGLYVMASDPIDMDSLLAEGEGLTWNGLPAGTVIGHIHLHVGDLRLARAFYESKLGFDVVGNFAGNTALFVSAGGYHHHIGLNIWAGQGAVLPPAHTVGLDYFTIELPSAEARDRLLEHLQREQLPVTREGDLRIVHDAAGIRIHLTVAS